MKPALNIVKNKFGQFKHLAIASSKGRTYLEMKHNLMLSYTTYLTFYLLMKVEGVNVENHPVIFKLAHIKALFEKLKPLDEKMDAQIQYVLDKSDGKIK